MQEDSFNAVLFRFLSSKRELRALRQACNQFFDHKMNVIARGRSVYLMVDYGLISGFVVQRAIPNLYPNNSIKTIDTNIDFIGSDLFRLYKIYHAISEFKLAITFPTSIEFGLSMLRLRTFYQEFAKYLEKENEISDIILSIISDDDKIWNYTELPIEVSNIFNTLPYIINKHEEFNSFFSFFNNNALFGVGDIISENYYYNKKTDLIHTKDSTFSLFNLHRKRSGPVDARFRLANRIDATNMSASFHLHDVDESKVLIFFRTYTSTSWH